LRGSDTPSRSRSAFASLKQQLAPAYFSVTERSSPVQIFTMSEPISPDTPFSTAIAELDEIVQQLANPKLDVDTVADRVERASALVEFCRARVDNARARVAQIRAVR
jgi:exodeoxyribonuclease VII small subunit